MEIEEFSFGNFKSFKEIQTLNLTSAKIKSYSSSLDENNLIRVNENLCLLKSKAVYGANSSGKSNLVKAIVSFIRIVVNSVKEEDILGLMVDPYSLSTETAEEPSFFQIVFRTDGIRYRYGFETTDETIHSEWLFMTPRVREQKLFVREGNRIFDINKRYFDEGVIFLDLMGTNDGEDQLFRPNSLFLSSLASFGFGKLSKKLVQSISSISVVSGLRAKGMHNVAANSLDDTKMKKFILDFLKKADFGIEDLSKVEIKEEKDDIEDKEIELKLKESKFVLSKRKIYNEKLEEHGLKSLSFSFQESEGTNKMFELSPFIYRALKEGLPLIVDEFDSRFHPLLTRKIVELFNSNQNKKSQLIFITHDTNLLSKDILRRDQIDFIEKDNYGSSHLYTLVEIKGVRNDASFEKDYIQGKYGAIPFLGNFHNILSFE